MCVCAYAGVCIVLLFHLEMVPCLSAGARAQLSILINFAEVENIIIKMDMHFLKVVYYLHRQSWSYQLHTTERDMLASSKAHNTQ